MGDRERTDGSGTRWCAGYPRATVHQVTVANVSANNTSVKFGVKYRIRSGDSIVF